MTQKLTLLFVDDDPSITSAVQIILEAKVKDCFSFTNPLEALRFTQENHSTRIDCAIIDNNLVEMSGLKLYENLCLVHTGLPVIFTSGLKMEFPEHLKNKKECLFILKPFHYEEILEKIHHITQSTAL